MRKLWIELRSSLWFLPTVLVLTAITLGFGLVELDVIFADRLKPWGWMPFLKAGAAGARAMLEVIASSMITIAGLAFSITIVTLSLASTQYTPRILRNFMRDRANQSVLGVFLGIYVYCLIVLRTIRDGNESGGGFVPLIAVSFGVLLALVGIGFLIFFIHHTAASIQASSILDAITKESLKTIDKLFPQDLGKPIENRSAAAAVVQENEWHSIPARATGYIQSVDGDALWKFASLADIVLRLECEIGKFVVEGEPLISSTHTLDEAAVNRLGGLIVIGNFRTVDQDLSFGIRQIVDIALKALSPAVNGTTTAVACLEYLGAILSRLGQRPMPSPYRKGDDKLRVVAPAPAFSDYVAESLDEIRHCASNNVTIFLSMFSLLSRVARTTNDPARQAVLLKHACLIAELADVSIPVPYDRIRINVEIEGVRENLRAGEKLPVLSVKPSREIVESSP
jgi:uncharacterized membrane protein